MHGRLCVGMPRHPTADTVRDIDVDAMLGSGTTTAVYYGGSSQDRLASARHGIAETLGATLCSGN
jgi:hypothetical protein